MLTDLSLCERMLRACNQGERRGGRKEGRRGTSEEGRKGTGLEGRRGTREEGRKGGAGVRRGSGRESDSEDGLMVTFMIYYVRVVNIKK